MCSRIAVYIKAVKNRNNLNQTLETAQNLSSSI